MTASAQQNAIPVKASGEPQWVRTMADLRAVKLLWKREMLRLRKNPMRILMSLLTPLLFLVVFATGLDAASNQDIAGMTSFRAYLFPGVLLMSVQAPATAVGVSLVLDRQRGVLRQMLAAPVKRASIVWGLALAGATTGAIYALPLLGIAWYAGIPYDWHLGIVMIEVALIALAFTTLGLVLAVTVRSIETFQMLLSLAMMPLLFLSGAMFPPGTVTGWLGVAVRLNPITYMVDALRRSFPGEPYNGDPAAALNLFGWVPPVPMELSVILILSAVGLAFAARRFTRTD